MALPFQQEMSPELVALATAAAQTLPTPGPFPPPAPRPGESVDAWRTVVASARAQHDAVALAASAFAREVRGAPPMRAVRSSFAEVPVAGGVVPVRVYRPVDAAGPLGVLVLVHGGAYWMGGGAAGFQMNDGLCAGLAEEAGVVVVSVDHRLAPEHPFPVPVDDVEAAVRWASRLDGVDATRLGALGISSGGNLVASAVQRLVAAGDVAVRAQVLQCPSMDLTLDAKRLEADGATIEGAAALVAMYAGGRDDADRAAMSPGLGDVAGTPDTLVVVARYDHLRADALAYAERLEDAGVPVQVVEVPMTHTVALTHDQERMDATIGAWLRARIGVDATPEHAVHERAAHGEEVAR